MENNTVRIVFTSDWASIRKFAPVMEEDPAEVYGDLKEDLAAADLRIVNLEIPLCDGSTPIIKSGPALWGKPESIASLKVIPFDVAVCANNHTFDCALPGYASTRKLLKENHIVPVGAGDDITEARKPFIFEKNGIKIGLFTLSEGEDMMGAGIGKPGVRPWEVKILADEIRERRKELDVILVSSHCGLEYQPYPSFYVWETFKTLAEAGADLIIGHHPHVPQGMTHFGKCKAFFSLGNFVFDQKEFFYRKTGFYLAIEVGKEGVASCEKVPYRIRERSLKKLEGKEKEEFEILFTKLSAPLANEKTARQAWNAVLAYNGIEGYKEELKRILAKYESDPKGAAAMQRNRLTCIQHSTQWLDGLTRIADGNIDDVPEEYLNMVKEYMTRKVDYE
ncbi:MAG: CapA family protein [Lentisphaeria bacterium]|nr:CapA family protein [Lentisphaeria bacterium]